MNAAALGYNNTFAFKIYGNTKNSGMLNTNTLNTNTLNTNTLNTNTLNVKVLNANTLNDNAQFGNTENSFLFHLMNSTEQLENNSTDLSGKIQEQNMSRITSKVETSDNNTTELSSSTEIEDKIPGSVLADRLSGKKKAPYSHLAKDGMIEYNGVTFMCDDEKQRITLGDVSNPKNCLTIALSEGGSLVVNRDNFGDLSDAISMFSPEDVRRILNAIAADNKAQEMQKQIEDDENSIGEAEESIGGKIQGSSEENQGQDVLAKAFSNMVNDEVLHRLCDDVE